MFSSLVSSALTIPTEGISTSSLSFRAPSTLAVEQQQSVGDLYLLTRPQVFLSCHQSPGTYHKVIGVSRSKGSVIGEVT